MSNTEQHAEALEKMAEVLEAYGFTVAEKVGILSVLQTSYILTASGVAK